MCKVYSYNVEARKRVRFLEKTVVLLWVYYTRVYPNFMPVKKATKKAVAKKAPAKKVAKKAAPKKAVKKAAPKKAAKKVAAKRK